TFLPKAWVTTACVTGTALAIGGMAMFGEVGQGISWARQTSPPPASVVAANDLSSAFRFASEQVIPSVVTIETVAEAQMPVQSQRQMQQIPEEFGPMFKRFFGEDFRGFESPSPRSFRQQGMGSGVIIDPSGIILTNNHVVAGGDAKVVVHLHDGREFEATDVHTDPKTDIAIIRIKGAGELPAAKVGNSDAVQIGDWVLAVGSPFGLDETVTAGIISAKSRGMGIAEREDFLQTDAAINPGNSGGPLVNLNGEVVGINTAISTRGGGSDGIGFAVPINLAKWVSDQLADSGSVRRAFLGVGIQPVNNSLSEQLGLKTVEGALVTEVRPDTAAAKAGLEVGDVIAKFDGQAIADPRSLQNSVERADLKSTHKLTVIRNGAPLTFEVRLQAMPDSLTLANSTPPKAETEAFNSLGIEVSDLTEEIASQLEIPKTSGVLITSVQPGTPAEESGLEPGMVIARVGTRAVASAKEFEKALLDVNLKDGVLLLVKTSQGSRFLVLKN
ncbi:MAG: Do family serine endopeptidase, partial [Planctomycetaceae bacterium]|nr:Do family serine endopeptidase [Planctomycetaceae bacterium]